MHIRILSDGKPGHHNQSLGLAQALARRTDATVETIELSGSLISRCRAAASRKCQPDIIIGTGRRTQLPLLWASRRLGAKSIVIMRSQLPLWLYDLAIIPQHDSPTSRPDTLTTRGPLNLIAEDLPPKEKRGLILIGGISKHYGWDISAIQRAIDHLIAARTDLSWFATDSRRTPTDFTMPAGVDFTPHTETPRGWVPDHLATATEVWVTPDSASMVYEALTAQAAVGLLPLPAPAAPTRISRGIDQLVTDGVVTTYSADAAAAPLRGNASPFHEAARIADEILARPDFAHLLP